MKIKDVLMEELDNKKSFTANWDTECEICNQDIMEGDDFYFFGEKRKVCSNCHNEMGDQIEAELT